MGQLCRTRLWSTRMESGPVFLMFLSPGEQDPDVIEIFATAGEVRKISSGSQELQAARFLPFDVLAHSMRVVLLFGKLSVCGRHGHDGYMLQMPHVCATQRDGWCRHLIWCVPRSTTCTACWHTNVWSRNAKLRPVGWVDGLSTYLRSNCRESKTESFF